ncbi:Divalent metal cation transporter [Rhodovastum atsumiense]|uniref:Divalent metal cation transporter n=1 Tax=Rhodovastum atsumiense TaxID=504468 RepID=A0A5M6IVL9_9PROT|nr:NRAMP family divalent metal transporter [Rhodovastum atsumiense]KAA5612271.1 divalent metal cation transporter [Rhodovastum atsumiense]CAH2601597.1 Divalent metal cation transporter [Rhodovastum atsumiense]
MAPLLEPSPVLVPAGTAETLASVAAPPAQIRGALGSIPHGQEARGWAGRLRTLLAVLGPGLIVMVGDNDAGAFAVYTQAGQDYGTALLWTLLLLVPVLYVNQEMVLRLGAVSGVGHAKLIVARFGRLWAGVSVISLLVLNALTIVTEFIGITLALDYLGLSRLVGVAVAAGLIMAAAGTGDFRRFERVALTLVAGSLLLLPVVLLVHPPLGQIGRDLLVPQLPEGNLARVLLLVVAIVGTTIAPWQLFFQQSYIVDKRITARFIAYEKADLWLGIVVVVVGAVAMMSFCAATFAGTPQAGGFTDVGDVARGLQHHAGTVPATLFALALLDASIIGAAAVSLSTAYAVGDLFAAGHSLHRRPREAWGFHALYAGLVAAGALLVLLPGVPLGLITEGVQTLAGVVLPVSTVFLLLLCNDSTVLGPWVNGRWMNLFTGTVVAGLVVLSGLLIAAVLVPGLSGGWLIGLLGVGAVGAVAVGIGAMRLAPARPADATAQRPGWRMLPPERLPAARPAGGARVWLVGLMGYLVLSCGMVVLHVAQVALGIG